MIPKYNPELNLDKFLIQNINNTIILNKKITISLVYFVEVNLSYAVITVEFPTTRSAKQQKAGGSANYLLNAGVKRKQYRKKEETNPAEILPWRDFCEFQTILI